MLQICSKVLPKLSPSFLNVVLKLSYVKELPKLSLSFLKVVRKLSDSCVNGFDLSHSCPEIVYKLPSCCSILVILVVQPSGRLVNSLDRIDGGLQMMGSRFCGPLSTLDRVTLSVLFLQQFQPSTGRHQAYTDHS